MTLSQKHLETKDTNYKMANNELYENTGKLIGLSFASSLSIGFALFFYAIFNDYVYYYLNQMVVSLQNSGLLGAWVNTLMETFQDNILVLIPNVLDLLWVVTFLLFVYSFLSSAYYVKREGYLSALSFLTFGIMVILFIMGIFVTLSDWFTAEFVAKVIPNLLYSTPFFSLYLQNIGLVNTTLIVFAIILNFVDLELSRFNFRKEPDQQANELS